MNSSVKTGRKKPVISVVIPCYNARKYIAETLDSVLNQSFPDYEVLCIDDGSQDGTGTILKEYQKKSEKIRVFSDSNHGQGYQRNAGIRLAEGKYIYFMDSDDLLRENALEVLCGTAEKDELDMLYFGGESFYENEKLAEDFPQYQTLYKRKAAYEGVYPGRELYIKFEENGDLIISPTLQMAKRDYLIKNDICFPDLPLLEDNIYTFHAITQAGRAACLPDSLYLRRVREHSLMTANRTADRMEAYTEIIKELLRAFSENEDDMKMRDAVYKQLRGVMDNVRKDYRSVPQKKEFMESLPVNARLAAELSLCMESVSRDKEKTARKIRAEKAQINEKLQRTYAEKSEINAKLQKTYAEKSEINAKLQKTYAEKSERGEQIKKLKQKNKKIKEDLQAEKEKNEKLQAEKEKLESHFLVRAFRKAGIWK